VSVSVTLKVKPADSQDLEMLSNRAIKESGVDFGKAKLRKKSLDSRSRDPFFLFQFDVYSDSETIDIDLGFQYQNISNAPEVHIVGFGPAGIFAALQCLELGLKPVILERGKDVRERRRDLANLHRTHEVHEDSNYCFGEGGAGTYSDGKLYTRSNKRGNVPKVLQTFVDHGALENILFEAHPHIGTNKLPGIIEKMRDSIRQAGGEVHFNTRITALKHDSGRITSVETANGGNFKVHSLILATGHSALDIFELLQRDGILIEAKPFALGVRLEHPQELIDQIQYKCFTRDPYLPASSYSLVEQVQGRGVFSFCMCPGGIIAPAATSPGQVVVNGWSPSKRNGAFANSGFVVALEEKDFAPFDKSGELRALHYQSHYEHLAWQTTQNLTAPAQRLEDFIQNKHSSSLPNCSYLPGIASRKIDEVLSNQVSTRIREALMALGKKMPAFRTNEAVLVGVESRTSSPVRIPRDSVTLRHPQFSNFYPCGEGAGYAGGIVSAAIDGMRCAIAVSQNSKTAHTFVSS
jgi:uncharacterized protein